MAQSKHPDVVEVESSRRRLNKARAARDERELGCQGVAQQSIRYPQAYFERKILVGKTLDFYFCIGEGFPIVGWLNALDLDPLFTINLPHYSDLIKEFYANILSDSIFSLFTRVKNRNIDMSSFTLPYILSILNDGT
ncbi:hypothetical protein CFOL_v3_05778 [Cephalotus follicularis]|uniref:Uncharacterized protein n=1 Tax=Cephalotus follicularis TaxID=3775 RepID=A0A1Q3B304_CEPFO|nr:hypothetical protein CFOL_v3_05778 [Cephalotus follicularis]